MQPNPYPDEPVYSQPTERSPQVAPPPDSPYYVRDGSYTPNGASEPPANNPNDNYPQRASQAYHEQEKARTVTYGVAKFIDYLKWVLLVLEVLFGLRFLLKLLGADPANPFASFLYALRSRLEQRVDYALRIGRWLDFECEPPVIRRQAIP